MSLRTICLRLGVYICVSLGIIPALESSHAVYHAMKLARSLPKDKVYYDGEFCAPFSCIDSILFRCRIL